MWIKYMSSKFNYFAPKKTTQHSVKSTQYTFKYCTKIFECFKGGRKMWFRMRGSQTCLIKWCVKWRFERTLVICIFLWNEKALANEDTLLRTHCCSWCSWAAQTRKHLLRPQNVSEQNQKHFLCPGHKICVRNKCCARRGKWGNICVGNNVSSFARA